MATADPGPGGRVNRHAGSWFAIGLLALAPLVGLAWAIWAGAGGADGAFTLATLGARLLRPAPWLSLGWSVAAALVATALATAGAIAVALAFRGTRTADRMARALATLPLPIPPIVIAAAAVLVLSQSGLLARLAAAFGWISMPAEMPALLNVPHGTGLILALAWKELGFLSLLACTIVAGLDPELEVTARTLGATERTARRRVLVPLIWRGILPGVVAAFAFVLGSYELPALLGPTHPQPLAVAVLERARDADPAARGDAWAATLLLFGTALAAVGWHEWSRSRA
jgi:putative spermidine/putrescine transport system permease protein